MSDSPDNDKAHHTLSRWLGLVHRENQVDSALDEKLKKMTGQKTDAEKVRTAVERSWAAIELRLDRADEDSTFGEKLAAFWYALARPWIWAPAAAAAVALVAIVMIWRPGTAEGIWFEIESKTASRRIDLSTQAFTAQTQEVIRGKLPHISLAVKSIRELGAAAEKSGTRLKFHSGDLFISYAPSSGRPELLVETNAAQYRVIGTRFLIRSDGKNDRLFVEEGTVQVTAGKSSVAVTAGQIWGSDRPAEVGTDKHAVADVLNELLGAGSPGDQKDKSAQKKPVLRFVTVHLANGNILKGSLLTETGQYIEIQVAGMGKKIKISRSEISRIQN